MIKIPVGKEHFAIIDDEDYELVSQFKWRSQKRRYTMYAVANIRTPNGKSWTTILMHCVILNLHTGIDHINADGLDNRRANLRPATMHENNGNYKKRKGKSQYKGVCRNTPAKNWKAQIRKGDRK